MARFLFGAIFTVAVIAMFQAVYYLYLDQYTLPTVTEPIEIVNENNEIAIGEPIVMKLSIYKPQEIATYTTKFITCDDGNLVTLAPNRQTLPQNDEPYTVTSTSNLLPPKVLVGAECEFTFRVEFEINPLKTDSREWTSETFTVIER